MPRFKELNSMRFDHQARCSGSGLSTYASLALVLLSLTVLTSQGLAAGRQSRYGAALRWPQRTRGADGFLRAVLFGHPALNPYDFCHRPVLIADPETRLGDAIQRLKASPHKPDDHIIDRDIILIWTDQVKRVITGADILGRLLIGIAPKAFD